MKKIISTCIALMVSAACSISAFAMEVPTNTTIQDLNGVRQYIKIYTVAPDTDPQSLIDDVFEYDGYTYTYSSMTKEEQSYSEKEHHTETVTADTEKSDLSVVLKALSPSIEYDDGEFRGTLYLDHSTISTVASGYTTKSYTVSTTKEIDNLDTNDMAYVPDTTTKNGVTVQLQSVDWQVQGTSLVDDIGTYVTGPNGAFTVTGLKKGTYICEEVSSDGNHIIDSEPQTVWISGEDQDVVIIRFGNSPFGSLLITKLSDDNKRSPIPNTDFLLTYIYPENLKAKPMLWLWLLRDIGVIGIGALLSVLALTQGLGMGLLVVTALYAFLTIQVDGSSILDFLRRAARFLFLCQQYYEWRQDL